MDMILDKKVELIEWLCGEDLILQHVQSRKLITTQEYTRIKSVRDPSDRATEVLDIIVGKGDSACAAFLNLLKEDKVNESKPELREWITTVNIPETEPRPNPSWKPVQTSAGASVNISAADGSTICTPLILNSQISTMNMNTNISGPQTGRERKK